SARCGIAARAINAPADSSATLIAVPIRDRAASSSSNILDRLGRGGGGGAKNSAREVSRKWAQNCVPVLKTGSANGIKKGGHNYLSLYSTGSHPYLPLRHFNSGGCRNENALYGVWPAISRCLDVARERCRRICLFEDGQRSLSGLLIWNGNTNKHLPWVSY